MWPGATISDATEWFGPRLSISYAFNEGVLGYMQDSDHRLRGQFSKAVPSAEIFFMTDALRGLEKMCSIIYSGFPATAGVSTLGDVYSNADGGDTEVMDTQFDPARHQGKINVIYFDGHVDTLEILPNDLEQAVISSK